MSEREAEHCEWIDDQGIWKSECGDAFIFEDGGPTENHFLFCPYCGRFLVIYEEEEE